MCFVPVLLFCNWTTLQETLFFISLSYYNSLVSCSSFIYTERISDLLFYIPNKNRMTKDFKGFNRKGVSELLVMTIAPNMIFLDNTSIFDKGNMGIHSYYIQISLKWCYSEIESWEAFWKMCLLGIKKKMINSICVTTQRLQCCWGFSFLIIKYNVAKKQSSWMRNVLCMSGDYHLGLLSTVFMYYHVLHG